MWKDRGVRGNQVFFVKEKHVFLAEEDIAISKGFSQVLLSQLYETCDRNTQLLLKSCKDISISIIGTGTTLVVECINRNDAYQIAQKANIVKQRLKIITGSIRLLFLFFKIGITALYHAVRVRMASGENFVAQSLKAIYQLPLTHNLGTFLSWRLIEFQSIALLHLADLTVLVQV